MTDNIKTADGCPVRVVGHNVYAMVKRGNQNMLAVSWKSIDPTKTTASDYSPVRPVDDLAAFNTEVDAIAVDQVARNALGRSDCARPHRTPWGPAQTAMKYATGIVFVTTAGHGGFMLSHERNEQIHSTWRSRDASYEEDSNWAVVAITWPEFFSPRELAIARKTMINDQPHQFSAATGEDLHPTESRQLRQEAFNAKHTNDLLVISAINTTNDMVKCTATKGGVRDNIWTADCYLVPRSEYAGRDEHAFVIDPSRHELVKEDALTV